MTSTAEAKSLTSDWPPARKFKRTEVIKLIHLYKSNPCLWNVKSKDYTRTGMKKKAYEEISHTFNVSISEIKRKIRSIRNTYLIEKKKVDESKVSGCTSRDMYEPKLAWFEEMSFLDESILMRRKIMTASSEDCGKFTPFLIQQKEKDEDTNVSEPPIKDDQKTQKKRRKKETQRKPNKHNITKHILKLITKEEDDAFTVFGKSIALQLKNLPEIESSQAMREIQGITTAYTIKYISKSNRPI